MKKPKEKALELVRNFSKFSKYESIKHIKDGSKQCAIIACEEIINNVMTGYLVNENSVSNFQLNMRDYYQEVKEELLNIKQWNLE